MSKRYNVLLPYSYEKKDKTRVTHWTTVGVGFASKDGDGINLEIRPGVALSGRVIIRPFKEKDTYASPEAAESHDGNFKYDQTPDEALTRV